MGMKARVSYITGNTCVQFIYKLKNQDFHSLINMMFILREKKIFWWIWKVGTESVKSLLFKAGKIGKNKNF